MSYYRKVQPLEFNISSIFDETIFEKSEMNEDQRGFLCGLLRDYNPQKILEVGVAAGGTTTIHEGWCCCCTS